MALLYCYSRDNGTLLLLRRIQPFFMCCLNYQKSTNANAIDIFATNLVEQKIHKWNDMHKKALGSETKKEIAVKQSAAIITNSILSDFKALNSLQLSLRQLGTEQLDALILTTLDFDNTKDLFYLLRQCITFSRLPSTCTIVKCMEKLSLIGETDLIENFARLCKENNNETFTKYTEFESFKTVSLWRSGKWKSAFENLNECYNGERSKISWKLFRSAFSLIAEESITTKSEAVLVCLLKTAESIKAKHRDIVPIAYVWKNCFQSEWFSDQEIAARLFQEHPELRDLTYKRTTSLCLHFLNQHKVDVVQRLIELFLKYERKESCKSCLILLFEYNYLRKDFRSCSEIIKSSSELEIPLGEDKSNKLLRLLLNCPSLSVKKPDVNVFAYKF